MTLGNSQGQILSANPTDFPLFIPEFSVGKSVFLVAENILRKVERCICVCERGEGDTSRHLELGKKDGVCPAQLFHCLVL